MKPRALTDDEMIKEFLEHISAMIDYWACIDENALIDKENPVKSRLEGLAFSILTTIDGYASSLPAYKLVPCPHSSDRDEDIKNGNNWYPNAIDIAGQLHDKFNVVNEAYKSQD